MKTVTSAPATLMDIAMDLHSTRWYANDEDDKIYTTQYEDDQNIESKWYTGGFKNNNNDNLFVRNEVFFCPELWCYLLFVNSALFEHHTEESFLQAKSYSILFENASTQKHEFN